MKRSLQHCWRHIRIGYVSALIVVDIAVLMIGGIDVWRYSSLGLSLTAAFRISLKGLLAGAVIRSFFFFLIILPVLLAIIRIKYLRGRALLSSPLAVRNHLITFLHICLSVLISYSISLTAAMQGLSGFSGVSGLYAFRPHFQQLFSTPLSKLLFWLLGGLLFILPIILRQIYEEKPSPKWLRDYLSRSFLADLYGDLYPSNGRHKLNFNAAAIAPETRYVKRFMNKFIKRYQQSIPGSNNSSILLAEALKESKILINKLFFKPQDRNKYEIELYSSTSRAIESAIVRLKPDHILLSPFEHPTEEELTNWLSCLYSPKLHRIKFTGNIILNSWDDQEEEIVQQAKDLLSQEKGRCVFLLSKIFYANGINIPTHNLISRLRRELTTIDLLVLLDGAHAVGNCQERLDVRYCDAYVFSMHKWLMSPEPCGALIHHEKSKLAAAPYDAWGNKIPSSTASPRMIGGVLGALSMISEVGLSYLASRSLELKNRFLDGIDRDKLFVPVLPKGLENTFIIAIRPATSFNWACSLNELEDYIKNKAINSYVLKIESEAPWIRVAFPYFLEADELNRVLSYLKPLVKH